MPINDKGTAWHFKNQHSETLGTCYQLPVKPGRKPWVGRYYGSKADFFDSQIYGEFDSLHECVDWVEHHGIGGYYL